MQFMGGLGDGCAGWSGLGGELCGHEGWGMYGRENEKREMSVFSSYTHTIKSPKGVHG